VNASTIAPLALTLMLSIAIAMTHRSLPPAFAARLFTMLLGVATIAAVPTLWVVTLTFVAHVPVPGGDPIWCVHAMGLHGGVPHIVGSIALTITAVGAVRMVRTLRLHRRLRTDAHGVAIAEEREVYGFSAPGAGGLVVLSRGLVDLLDDDERAVVIAHERAHHQHRHDRLLLLARLSASAMPLLRPLERHLHFALERWADETAARACGDRTLVGTTLGRVALHARPTPGLAFNGLGVPERVAALLGPAPVPPSRRRAWMLLAALCVTVALAAVQVHHLGALAAALCFTG
jgi:hypothetical protein